MRLFSTYSVKIKHYNHIFKDTVCMYRDAVDFLIVVCLNEWSDIDALKKKTKQYNFVEHLCHQTADNPMPKYDDFDKKFYKFPCYLRRSAISQAIGKVSSYKSNLKNWELADKRTRGKKPSYPKAGYIYPCMYRTDMYQQVDTYTAKIKVYIRNTWDWLTIQLRKTDIDYINRRCASRTMCAPTLQKRGHEWFLDFPFEEHTELVDVDIHDQTILAVDLGILNAATVAAMRSDGTVLGRHFCKLTSEYDSLKHCIGRIKKAQHLGNRHMPRLWAKAKGVNRDIAVKTAHFIMEIAALYNADTIVFEHLDFGGKKRGSKKQRLHLWRSQYVQAMVTQKAHRAHMHISHICAWGTSHLAFDGSGAVLRGSKAGFKSYSLCKFQNGKVYNCDLSAAYNIGSRYFIRELLKALPVKARLALEAKVPQAAKRSTCTLSTLISLNAELAPLMTQDI